MVASSGSTSNRAHFEAFGSAVVEPHAVLFSHAFDLRI